MTHRVSQGIRRGGLPLAAVGLLLAAGCFTVSETEYPAKPPAASGTTAATNVTVSVVGFAATLTEYVVAYGYQTMWMPGGRRGLGGDWATVNTATYLPRERETDAFRLRAQDFLEESGFNVAVSPGDWVVEATFAGPVDSGSPGLRALATICSLFTYDAADMTWTAKLRIRDNRTGRLAFHRDYSQRHEIGVFSPIPLFGISGCERTGMGYAQSWCLSALTDRMAADAVDFLRQVRR